jgi:molybdopterin-guanine dinucleotide biosynthesis protein A
MGTDKALIEIGDKPLARRVADEIGSANPNTAEDLERFRHG